MLSTPREDNPSDIPSSPTEILRVDSFACGFKDQDFKLSIQNLILYPGQIIALAGESGSGKSLLAHSIIQSVRKIPNIEQQGEIWFKNCDLVSAQESKLQQLRSKEIGLMLQEPMQALNPLHSIGYQIEEAITLHQGLKKSELKQAVSKIGNIISLDIDDPNMYNKLPHELSGGQRQRALLGVAIANLPQILIADEPTTALDAHTQKAILAQLKKLQQHHSMAIVLVTHDLCMLKHFADYVYVMRQGSIIEHNTTQALFKYPQHPYTKSLLDAHNFQDSKPPIINDDTVVLSTEKLAAHYQKISSWWSPVPKPIIQDIHLSLQKKMNLGIIGESGSGKSTLAKAILQLIPYQGKVCLNQSTLSQQDPEKTRQLRRHVQMVFQDPFSSLNPRMSVSEIIGEGLAIHHPALSKEERANKIDHILQSVELPLNCKTRYPHEFSGGQRQRIAIARALVIEPDILVLDEPTTALDATIQKQILQLLQNLQKTRAISYLLITHNCQIVQTFCQQVAVMQKGRIIEYDNTDTLFNQPKHPYTKSLLEAQLV